MKYIKLYEGYIEDKDNEGKIKSLSSDVKSMKASRNDVWQEYIKFIIDFFCKNAKLPEKEGSYVSGDEYVLPLNYSNHGKYVFNLVMDVQYQFSIDNYLDNNDHNILYYIFVNFNIDDSPKKIDNCKFLEVSFIVEAIQQTYPDIIRPSKYGMYDIKNEAASTEYYDRLTKMEIEIIKDFKNLFKKLKISTILRDEESEMFVRFYDLELEYENNIQSSYGFNKIYKEKDRISVCGNRLDSDGDWTEDEEDFNIENIRVLELIDIYASIENTTIEEQYERAKRTNNKKLIKEIGEQYPRLVRPDKYGMFDTKTNELE